MSHRAERRVHRRQPADSRRARRCTSCADRALAEHGRRRRHLRRGEAVHRGACCRRPRPSSASTSPRVTAEAGRADAIELQQAAHRRCGIATAARCRPGWMRWLLEQYEFAFEVVYPPALDAGNLRAKYDVLIFPDGGIPESDGAAAAEAAAAAGGRPSAGGHARGVPRPAGPRHDRPDRAAAEAVRRRGRRHRRVRQLAVLGHHLGLPVSDTWSRRTATGQRAAAAARQVLHARIDPAVAVDNTNPLAYGLDKQVDVMFDNSPVLQLAPDATLRGVKPVAWFDSKEPLRSGWAWGQHYLEGGVAGRRGRRSARASCSCSARRSRSAPSRTARSSSCSTASTTARRSPSARPAATRRRRSNQDKSVGIEDSGPGSIPVYRLLT